jgi:adenosylcobinamide-GDP ribazoletransferase
MNDFLAAVALLTIVPIRRTQHFSAHALAFFPVVGALLGGVLVASFLVSRIVFPPLVTAALLVALWALLTGALHLDGVSDACDALFAETTRARRLEILRDVHMGAFGATGLILILLLKFSALNNPNLGALFLAPILARWAMVYAAAYPLARQEGMAVLFVQKLTRREIGLATIFGFIFAVPFGWLGVSAWLTALGISTLLARFALARFGGLTGDVYGMICESVEVSVLLAGLVVGARSV